MSKSSYLKNFTKVRSPAELAFQNLSGLFCIYKPADVDLIEVMRKVKYGLVRGINALDTRPVQEIVQFDEANHSVYLQKNAADTIQALGYRYLQKDFKMTALHPLDIPDSGVQIFSLNDHGLLLNKINSMRLMRVYELKGQLGVWTDNFIPTGSLVQKASYAHVNRSKMDRLMSTIQLTYQREMYKNIGVDLQSQEAYELASKGLLRPKSTSTPPQIYSIRCIELTRPFFKIEVYTINESTRFFRQLIHDIGMRLKAYAVCHQIRRIKDGFIGSDSSKCLSFNELNYDRIYQSTLSVTETAQEYVKKYDKTILVGHTKNEEKEFLNLDNNSK